MFWDKLVLLTAGILKTSHGSFLRCWSLWWSTWTSRETIRPSSSQQTSPDMLACWRAWSLWVIESFYLITESTAWSLMAAQQMPGNSVSLSPAARFHSHHERALQLRRRIHRWAMSRFAFCRRPQSRSVVHGDWVSNLLLTWHRNNGMDLWEKRWNVDELPDPLRSRKRKQVILLFVEIVLFFRLQSKCAPWGNVNKGQSRSSYTF